MWSVDPRVVREASQMFIALVHSFAPRLQTPELPQLSTLPPPLSSDMGRTKGMFDRMLDYLDGAPVR